MQDVTSLDNRGFIPVARSSRDKLASSVSNMTSQLVYVTIQRRIRLSLEKGDVIQLGRHVCHFKSAGNISGHR